MLYIQHNSGCHFRLERVQGVGVCSFYPVFQWLERAHADLGKLRLSFAFWFFYFAEQWPGIEEFVTVWDVSLRAGREAGVSLSWKGAFAAVFIPGKTGFVTQGSESRSGKGMTPEFLYEPLPLTLQQRLCLKSQMGQRLFSVKNHVVFAPCSVCLFFVYSSVPSPHVSPFANLSKKTKL